MSAGLTLEALALLIHAHRARLPDAALLAVESLARAEGASRTQIAAAVARSYE